MLFVRKTLTEVTSAKSGQGVESYAQQDNDEGSSKKGETPESRADDDPDVMKGEDEFPLIMEPPAKRSASHVTLVAFFVVGGLNHKSSLMEVILDNLETSPPNKNAWK